MEKFRLPLGDPVCLLSVIRDRVLWLVVGLLLLINIAFFLYDWLQATFDLKLC